MRIEKTIKGEKFHFYIQFVPNTMIVNVRYFQADVPVTGIITSDFKKIELPKDFMSSHISGVGQVPIKSLKLNRALQREARDYNEKK